METISEEPLLETVLGDDLLTEICSYDPYLLSAMEKIPMVPNCEHCFIVAAQCNLLEEQVLLMQSNIDTLTSLLNTSNQLSTRANSCTSSNTALDNIEYDDTVYDMEYNLDSTEPQHYEKDTSDNVELQGVYVNDSNTLQNQPEPCSLSNEIGTQYVCIQNHLADEYHYEDISEAELDLSEEEVRNPEADLVPDSDTVNLPLLEVQGNPFSLFRAGELEKHTQFTHNFDNRNAVYYGEYPYSYTGGVHEPRNLAENLYLAKICSYLDIVLPNYEYNSAMVHRYKSGADFMPSHSDSEESIVAGSNIVTISLGASRTMELTTTDNKPISSLTLNHGQVLIMSQSCQSSFKHGIPPENCSGTRLSITFRLIKPTVRHSPTSDSLENLSSLQSGYAPYNRPEPPVQQGRNCEQHQPRDKQPCHNSIATPPNTHHDGGQNRYRPYSSDRYKPPSTNNQRYPPKQQDTPCNQSIYISSSMFRELDVSKMSSKTQKASVFSYSGAHASLMHNKLQQDRTFCALNPLTVRNVFLLTGTNNIDSIYFGSRKLSNAKTDIDNLVYYLKERFQNADINVVNVLPRITKGRRDVIQELNFHIRNVCNKDRRLHYIDTESENSLFTYKGARREAYFIQSVRFPDNVHLNTPGTVRLGKHLKHIAHSKY